MNMAYTTPGSPIEVLTDLSKLECNPYLLAIDDNVEIVKSILLLMEMEGYSCLAFSKSTDVLPFLEKLSPLQLPGAVLTDLTMPGVSGYQIASALSASPEYAPIRVVAMSADYRPSNARDIPGADDFVLKPFQIDNLLDKLVPYIRRPFDSNDQNQSNEMPL